MRGGSILENEILIFWLACLEVAVSLRAMRPTSSDARLWGPGECCHVSRCICLFKSP